jgi:hypothetical protein
MKDVPPPGEHQHDPYVKDIDAVGFALERVVTHLQWIDEHLATFLATRETDPKLAERELDYLADSLNHARRNAARLTALVLAGYGIDPSKRIPKLPKDPKYPIDGQ